MSQKQETFANRIVMAGTFDVDKIYKTVLSYLKENGYETIIKENTLKNKPQGKEIMLKINAERKVDDYVRNHFKIDFLIRNVHKVNGTKLDQGDLRLFLNVGIELDYRHNWERTKLGKWVRDNLYHKYFIKFKITGYYHGKLYEEAMTFFNLLKDVLELHS